MLLGQMINAYMALADITRFPFREVVTFFIRKIPVFPQPHQENILSSF